MNEIEVNLSQEKINFINDAYQKELQYWKELAFKKASIENKAKELTDLAPSRVFLIRKAAIKNKEDEYSQNIFLFEISIFN